MGNKVGSDSSGMPGTCSSLQVCSTSIPSKPRFPPFSSIVAPFEFINHYISRALNQRKISMIKSTFALFCALLLLIGGTVLAQENPAGTPKGKEHRTRKAGGTQSASTFGDGSVHFDRNPEGMQSSGAGAGKISRTSGSIEAGNADVIPGGWNKNKVRGAVTSTQSKTGKTRARSLSKHPGGAN
jgi:hypothetical protein